VLALKGNQGTLNEDIELYFQDAVELDFSSAAFDYHKTVDKDHGRIEIRERRTSRCSDGSRSIFSNRKRPVNAVSPGNGY
jgi:predicted transposase YbfD/YdcC